MYHRFEDDAVLVLDEIMLYKRIIGALNNQHCKTIELNVLLYQNISVMQKMKLTL